MERLRGISEILNELGFGVKYVPLFGDNVQVLRRTVNDMPNDALGAKQLRSPPSRCRRQLAQNIRQSGRSTAPR